MCELCPMPRVRLCDHATCASLVPLVVQVDGIVAKIVDMYKQSLTRDTAATLAIVGRLNGCVPRS